MKLNNHSSVTIVIPAAATSREIFAAEELSKYLSMIFPGIGMQTVKDAEVFAEYFGEATPAAMVENCCVIVIGNTLLQAFDRLEVMESTAHSIINAAVLGEIVHISEDEVADLKKAFHLVD